MAPKALKTCNLSSLLPGGGSAARADPDNVRDRASEKHIAAGREPAKKISRYNRASKTGLTKSVFVGKVTLVEPTLIGKIVPIVPEMDGHPGRPDQRRQPGQPTSPVMLAKIGSG